MYRGMKISQSLRRMDVLDHMADIGHWTIGYWTLGFGHQGHFGHLEENW